MSKAKRTILTICLAVLAAGSLVASLKLPLWHMRMEAPQYRDEEALRVNVFAGSMNGDLGEITVLNQYIGVHVPEVLPQSRWLPPTLCGAAVLGFAVSLFPRRVRQIGMGLVSLALAGAVAFAVMQARQQMYDIGHNRDAQTKMVGFKDFTPPFLGTAKIAQFTVSSWLGAGAYLIGAAIFLQAGAAIVSGRTCRPHCNCKKSQEIPTMQTSEALV